MLRYHPTGNLELNAFFNIPNMNKINNNINNNSKNSIISFKKWREMLS